MTTPALPTAFLLNYADETYRIEILDHTRLRWTRTRGAKTGVTDEESYVATHLGAQRWLITWIEATGLGLTSAIDLSTRQLVTHANEDRSAFENPGMVTIP